MVEVLKKGRDLYGYISLKAEFEAEGTRIDELLRLVEIANKSALSLTVKIGGCEAIRDLLEARQFGVQFIVAPMVETPYALKKYIAAKNHVYSIDEQKDTQFLFNVETTTAFANLDELVTAAKGSNGVSGLVFGRVDYVGSLEMSRESINDESVERDVLKVASECRRASLDLVVGGGVSPASIPFLQKIKATHLSRFETRKIVFDSAAIDDTGIEQGLLNAVQFEMLWLLNKQNYYKSIGEEDATRIDMLQKRWNVTT